MTKKYFAKKSIGSFRVGQEVKGIKQSDLDILIKQGDVREEFGGIETKEPLEPTTKSGTEGGETEEKVQEDKKPRRGRASRRAKKQEATEDSADTL